MNAEDGFRVLELVAEGIADKMDEINALIGVEDGEVTCYCVIRVRGALLGVATQEDDQMAIADSLGGAAASLLHAMANGGDEAARRRIRDVSQRYIPPSNLN